MDAQIKPYRYWHILRYWHSWAIILVGALLALPTFAADEALGEAGTHSNAGGFWALLFDKGGVITWVIALLSAVGVPMAAIKIYQFVQMDIWRPAALEQMMQTYRQTALPDAAQLATRFTQLRHPAGALIAFAIEEAHTTPDKMTLKMTLSAHLLREETTRRAQYLLRHLSRHIWVLELIAASAPLFGLLGTVLGMIVAFQGVSQDIGGADTALLAAGIWEALLTTAFGLAVALPFSIVAGVLNNAVENVRDLLQDALSEILVRGEASAESA